MKILYLAPEPGITYSMSGGAGTHIRGTVEPLIVKGNEVGIFIGGDYLRSKVVVDNYEKSARFGLRLVIKSMIPGELRKLYNDFKRIRIQRKLTEGLESFLLSFGRPDIIYERSAYGLDLGLKIATEHNIPYCLESDVILLDLVRPHTSYFFNKLIYKNIERKKMSGANGLFVMSQASIPLLRRLWNIDHNQIYFKGLGINVSKRLPKKSNVVNSTFGLEGKIVIGYVGIFQDYQNLPILFDLAELFLTNPRVVILVVGTGRRLEEYKREVAQRSLTNVIFTGLIDSSSIVHYYHRIDYGVITDNPPHMYPVKYLEFLSYNKPVFFPSYASFHSFFENDLDLELFSFSPGEANSLKLKIEAAMREKDRIQQVTQQLSRLVQFNYSWDRCADRLVIGLENVIENKD